MKLNTKTLTGQWSLMRSALVIVLFVVGMIFTQITINKAVTEFDRREFYSARLEEVGQFGWEFRTFYETAIAVAKGEDWATRKDMNRALDIFWSRTHTLAQADYIEAYDDQNKAQLVVKRLKGDLPNFEKAANAIEKGKPETAVDLEALYFAHRQEVLDLAQAAYHKRRNKAASALEAQFEATSMLKSLNIALGVGGLLGFLYLLFELFRSRKLARKLHETNRKVREVAETDFLTGLFNRRAFSEHLEKRQADDQTGEFNLLLLDLDGFKPINDRLGHVAGDVVLNEIGKRLNSLAGASLIARLGGDEFALVVEGTPQRAAELADRVIEAISARIDYEGATVSITGSIGITTVNSGQHRTMSDLMHEADLALYEAKGRGRRQSCFYHPSMASELRRRVQIEEELSKAIQNQAIEIVFQPIVNGPDGEIVALEALSRWLHPVTGAIGPEEMFDIADEIGLGPALGNYVLEQACRSAKPIFDAAPDIELSINIRPSHASGRNFVENCLRAASANGVNTQRLVLEFTENDMAQNYGQIGENLSALSAAGIRFAIDDFGKGYSSYARLTQFPFSLLKLDSSLITHIETDSRVSAMVSALVSMTRKLGAELIVEGVETGTQYSKLQLAGVTRFQGFLFAMPMTADDLLTWLKPRSTASRDRVF